MCKTHIKSLVNKQGFLNHKETQIFSIIQQLQCKDQISDFLKIYTLIYQLLKTTEHLCFDIQDKRLKINYHIIDGTVSYKDSIYSSTNLCLDRKIQLCALSSI